MVWVRVGHTGDSPWGEIKVNRMKFMKVIMAAKLQDPKVGIDRVFQGKPTTVHFIAQGCRWSVYRLCVSKPVQRYFGNEWRIVIWKRP